MSIFNQPIDPKIVGSLTRRQELMGKENRTSKELSFLNSQTTWVSLKSSVNVNGDDGALAKSNILLGGTLTQGNQLFSRPKSGISAESAGAYNLKNSDGSTNTLGIKPMPGINSVSVDNIGVYGSLRKATINFQCWDIKQLEILEKLYMRPGYTVLLEFGRTSYLDDKGNIQNISDDLTFFNEQGINLQEYLNKLHKKSLKYEGNYDAFFGYITNYGWNARPDGGYDCKTEIISTGEILESLKVNYSLAGAINYKSLSETPELPNFKGLLLPASGLLGKVDETNKNQITKKDVQNLNNEYTENIIAGLMYELYLLGFEGASIYKDGTFPIKLNGKDININFNTAEYISKTGKTPKGEGKFNVYITLKTFVDLFNTFILPKAFSSKGENKGELVSLSVNDRSYISSDPLLCLYNPLILSTNPDVCWVKNENWVNLISQVKTQTNILSIDPLRFRDKDIQEGAQLRKIIIGWINDLAEANSKTTNQVVANIKKSISTYANGSAKLEQEYINKINKNYIALRGQKQTDNTKKYVWELYQKEGGTKTEKLNNSPFVPLVGGEGPGNLSQLILKAFFTPVTKEDRDLLINLQKVYPEVNADLENIKRNVDEAKIQQAQERENVNTLDTISNNFQVFNNSFNQNFIVTGGVSQFGEIGNIYLNVKHLWTLSKDPSLLFQDQNGENKLSCSSYIKKLLQDIQSSLCNLNNFELHIDPVDGVGRIIDLNYINKNKPDLFKFEIGSNKSIVRDLKLESQIFSDQSSIIAISAQDKAGVLGSNNSTLVGFNEGITDRMIVKKDSYLSTIYIENQQQTIVNNYISSLSFIVNNYLKLLLGLSTESYNSVFQPSYVPLTLDAINKSNTAALKGAEYDANQSLSYSNSLRDIMFFFASIKSFNLDSKERQFIPTLLSLTIDGLSGFIIGNLFKVDNTFVPNYYKKGDKLGYTITKINHELTNNDWITTISGYPFNLDNNNTEPDAINKIIERDVIVDIDPNPVGTIKQQGQGTQVRSELVASFNDEIIKINQKYGSKYSSKVGARVAQLKNKTFENAMKTLFEAMAQDNTLKNEKIILKSILRPGDVGSKHSKGEALDFNLTDATVDQFPNFKNKLIDINRLYGPVKSRIDYIENFLKRKFPGIPQKTSYILKVNGIGIEMTNEYYYPSKDASGPHFHFELQF